MLDRELNVDELAADIFQARHFCARDFVQLDPACSVAHAGLLMQLHEQDQMPIRRGTGREIVLRHDLDAVEPTREIGDFAVTAPSGHCIEANTSLRDAIARLGERGWLLVLANGDLLGVLNRRDLGSPVVSAYLLSVILGIERGLRRLYGSYTGKPIPDEPMACSLPRDASELAEGQGPDTFYTTAKCVRSCRSLVDDLQFSGSKHAKRVLYDVISLRNHLAHARSVLEFGESPADVLNRIHSLESLASTVRQLLLNRDAIWNSYAGTVITSGENSSVVFAGPGAEKLPMVAPVHVISAQNPYEQFLGKFENLRRTEVLGQYLRATPGVVAMEQVIGRSSDPDATWKEESWAVSGLTRSQALDIAKHFQQRAIFELTESDMIVVAAGGSPVSVLPRRSG